MPAIRQLSTSLQGSTITWLTTKRTNPQLFSALPFISKTLVLPTGFISLIFFLFRLCRMIRKFDLVIDYDQYYRISELFAYLGKFSAGFLTPLKGRRFDLSIEYDPTKNEKVLFQNLTCKVLGSLGTHLPNQEPRLPEILLNFMPNESLQTLVNQYFSSNRLVVVLYPGSSQNAKYRRWDWYHYLELATLLTQRDIQVIFAGGADEREFTKQLVSTEANIHNWIGMWSLIEWFWIFHTQNLIFCGTDAGLYHLADLAGAQTIGIFGPNISTKWGSINPQSRIVESSVACRPCIQQYLGKVPQECAIGTVECLTNISVESVLNQIEHVVEVKYS